MIGNTGSSLPEVTAEDNGKVLAVVEGQWDKGDPGYSVDISRSIILNESVTTVKQSPDDSLAIGELSILSVIDSDELEVTFNDTKYVCPVITTEFGNFYGAPWSDELHAYDWSEYPFTVASGEFESQLFNEIYTEDAGTYSLKIEEFTATVETTEGFERAVKSVVPPSGSSKFVVTFTGTSAATYRADCTLEDVIDAYNSGKVVEGRWLYPSEPDFVTVLTLSSLESNNEAIFSSGYAYRGDEQQYIYMQTYHLNADDSVNMYSCKIHAST